MTNTLKLSRQVVNNIMTEAQKSPDLEICGLIGGSADHGQHSYAITNVANAPAQRYEMDPGEQIQAIKTMREQQQDLVAIYHSHPSSSAQPSSTDIEQAAYPDAIYLILSLDTVGVLELSAFRIQQKQVIPVELELE